MRGHLLLIIVTLAALSNAALYNVAQADTLPIKGSYGNKDGCAYAKSGESTGSDNFFLLTSESITTAVSYCEIKKVLKSEGKNFTATISCHAEGEESGADDTARITSGPKGYTIGLASDAAIKWGPLPLCK
ncbi:hypothetical protein [Rhizobium sp. WYJ-E13]|uniref:hypothetical protein n=1 Tax=Rhizobium sp. WYJ-E13 TaxID=2849093 RepID=UPI001C1EFCAB|nr:hypothetical protein [Rhizobium sp. WYJ-E13]QWW66854.1 hypothetical protein KQ933_14665 [Rhizobium sp. WYJ-E13]